MTTQLIPIARIQPDVAAQPRVQIDVDKIAEYADDMKRGDTFPALIVFYDKEARTHWLADGFHRYHAARTANLTDFPCDVRPGTKRDAILYSCGANAAHGLRRTNEDKRRAIAKLLDDEEWREWSDEEIARHCAVSGEFVRRARKVITSNVGSERKFTTKHGTESTMNTANIGRKPQTPVAELEPHQIANYLKGIKTAIAVMPEPEVAALRFPEEQRYFYPISDLRELAQWLSAFADAMEKRMVQPNEQPDKQPT